MMSLPHFKLDVVRDRLRKVELDDLVAVFTQTAGDGLLLVYNAASCPSSIPDNCEAIVLYHLSDVDLDVYDGFLVGISALDVIRDDLVTKGPAFYPLERIFVELGQRATLHRTFQNLARYLVDFLNELSDDVDPVRRQRVVLKVLRLALPALLDSHGADNLVAVLPGSDLASFVIGEGGEWLTVADDLESGAVWGGTDWVIAFEEVGCLNPHFDPDKGSKSGHFIELRDVLREAGYAKELHKTCRTLAQRYARMATDRSDLWATAWSLMVEAWLAVEDVEGLLAFFLHADFEYFAQTGQGLRVYRTLSEDAANVPPGPCWSLADLSSNGVPDGFCQHSFSLVPLESSPGAGEQETQAADLGWLLWKAGQDVPLTQTLWLLARDGLEDAPVAGELPLGILVGLSQRALMLISLGDPWGERQGRHGQLVDSIYRTLRELLLRRASSNPRVEGAYYRALADWYNCHNVGMNELEDHLRQIVRQLRRFRRTVREEDHQPDPSFFDTAQKLVDVEEAALNPLATMQPEEDVSPEPWARVLPGEIDRLRGLAAQQGTNVPDVSVVFERIWRRLLDLRQRRHRIQMRERDVDVLQHKLETLLGDARKQRRLIFAPPHEATVLRFVYEREIADLEDHLRELKTSARLQVTPLNPHIEFLREVELTFEVRNTGRVGAQDLEIVLAPGTTFELLDRSSVREFPSLPPGERQRFSYRVQAFQQPEAVFDFNYTYTSLEKLQEISIRLPVHSLDRAPFKMKGDPYQFGRAIQDPADFYGREEEMRRLLSSLYSGGQTNIMLRGPRRMGKTSMLYMLRHLLEDARVRRRYDIPEDWDPALSHCVPIMLDLQAFQFQDDVTHVKRFFHTLLDEICAALVPDLRTSLVQKFEKRRREIDTSRAVIEQLGEVFRNQPGARVVVLLDEYDEIYHPHGRALDTALRHVVQTEQRLTWIIASTLFMFKEGKSYGSPWFNILDTVELDCLTHEAARRLIEEPSKNEEVAWQSDAVVALLEETGRHPAFLQLFCSRIMTYLNEEKENYVLPETIITLADQIVEGRGTVHRHFEFYWTDTPGVGRLILLAADDSEEPPTRLELQKWVREQLEGRFGSRPETRVLDANDNPIPWWEREFEDGMAWVSQVVNALSFDRASRTYFFTVPLFRRWLQRQRRYEDLLESALNTVEAELERDDVE